MRSLVALARLSAAALLAAAVALGPGCRQSPVGPAPAPSSSVAPAPFPTTLADAEAARKGGASWTNEQIRARYNELVSAIGPANEGWKREGLPAEERAHRAFTLRHDARILTRALMSDPRDVGILRRRDQEKYGDPDGPTFEWLLESNRKKGVTGDAAFEAIVASAQRTDEKVNSAFGVGKP